MIKTSTLDIKSIMSTVLVSLIKVLEKSVSSVANLNRFVKDFLIYGFKYKLLVCLLKKR